MTSVKNGKYIMQSEFEKRTMNAFAWFAHYSQKKVWDLNTKLKSLHIESITIGPPPAVSFRLTVTPEMCNDKGIFHAGCAATYIGSLTSILLVGLSRPGFYSLFGVGGRNLSITLFWSISEGKDARIVCSVVNAGKRMAALKAEIFRVDTGELCIVGVHEKMNTDPSSLQKI